MTSVKERLESIGITVEPYRRGPLGKDPFAMAVNGKRLRLWEGSCEITVSTDKRRRQAVITVVEPARQIKTFASLYWGFDAAGIFAAARGSAQLPI